MREKILNSTFGAKVDIVTIPDNIRNYSSKRYDYSELALTAIRQKPDVIKYISSSYKDYYILCKEAVDLDCKTFLLIKDSVRNYKQLGIEAVMKAPFLVLSLDKEIKYYYFFWELAIFMCYEVLMYIGEENNLLFQLIERAIQQEPLAIIYVDSKISIYSKLCNIAYAKNKESIKYMNINCVDKYLVMEIIRKEPEKIKYLDTKNDYYEEAWRLALSINGLLIDDFYYFSIKEREELDNLFELIDIAKNGFPEIIDYPVVIYALCLENRKMKEKILSTSNILGNNIFMLLKELDDEYKSLLKEYKNVLRKETKKEKVVHSDVAFDCPIKEKMGKYCKRKAKLSLLFN